MAGNVVNLTTVAGGMNLLREKGGAPRKNLRVLLNGFVGQDGGARSRYGTQPVAVGASQGHRGFVSHKGKLYTFHHAGGDSLDWVNAIIGTATVETIVLVNPNAPDSPIKEVHFAGQYMGVLYVVVEYDNGDVFHFWLESVEAWQPGKIYMLGQLVMPVGDQTGYAYRVTRQGAPFPPWAAGVARAIGDKVEPTTVTGWYYEVSNTIGDNPRSGTVEPTWPQVENEVVWEDVDGVGSDPTGSAGQVPDTTLPPDMGDRYGNPGGSKPGTDGVRYQER